MTMARDRRGRGIQWVLIGFVTEVLANILRLTPEQISQIQSVMGYRSIHRALYPEYRRGAEDEAGNTDGGLGWITWLKSLMPF